MREEASLWWGIYIFSLSESGDDLSQWRAYCPPLGGYALGFPARHLKAVGEEQGFYLAPCVYDDARQSQLIDEVITSFVALYHDERTTGHDADALREPVARSFGARLRRLAPLLKHASFAGESEWRLVSMPKHPQDERVQFRPGSRNVIPYYELCLTTNNRPRLAEPGGTQFGVIVGPTADSASAQVAVQALLLRQVGPGCWHGRTSTPYRGW